MRASLLLCLVAPVCGCDDDSVPPDLSVAADLSVDAAIGSDMTLTCETDPECCKDPCDVAQLGSFPPTWNAVLAGQWCHDSASEVTMCSNGDRLSVWGFNYNIDIYYDATGSFVQIHDTAYYHAGTSYSCQCGPPGSYAGDFLKGCGAAVDCPVDGGGTD